MVSEIDVHKCACALLREDHDIEADRISVEATQAIDLDDRRSRSDPETICLVDGCRTDFATPHCGRRSKSARQSHFRERLERAWRLADDSRRHEPAALSGATDTSLGFERTESGT
ncbi:hypothetical protein GCM10007269_09430 [Microbacterium murale]|uniref:Uncharacterized protein n=1 Tax=Microbacterium murale TaxID=1081040 RepID=A0ABQ1RJ66_9MICO|nr:hypothetical protein GCM10007269_09430 [Microbacterium murale]